MLALISDIHGNYPALKAVLDHIDKLGVREVVSLGDIAGYYSMINECCDELKRRQILNLMGNHDEYLTTGAPCPRSRSANTCLAHQRKTITDANLEWIAKSPHRLQKNKLSLVHAGWLNPVDEDMSAISTDYFEHQEGKYFASGHTHVQILWRLGKKVYCNPGSVGQPRDGDPRASFAIWSGEDFKLHRVPYDVSETVAHMRISGLTNDHLYKNLYIGTRIGGTLSHMVTKESSQRKTDVDTHNHRQRPAPVRRHHLE